MTLYKGDQVTFPRRSEPITGTSTPTTSYTNLFRGIWQGMGYDGKAPRFRKGGESANRMLQPASNAPDQVTMVGGIFALGFDASTEESLSFSVTLDNNYREGSDLAPYVDWTPSDGTAGNVVWGMEYTIANKSSAFPSTTSITATSAAAGTADTLTEAEFTDITGTTFERGAVMHIRVYRKAAAAADTYAADAFLLEAGIAYQFEGSGSVRGNP